MDWLLLILGLMLILSGIAGAVLPIVPGPPLAWLGILAVHWVHPFSTNFLFVSGILMAGVTALDYIVPVWGTKKLGGTEFGIRGATAGMLVGLFFLPIGLILGPFFGAFIGELFHNRNDTPKAWRSALGSFLGFLAGTMIKLTFGFWMLVVWVQQVW
jgi:uncharacterized protein YqgC (DUF456 family)